MQITYSKYVIYDPETNHKHNSFFHCALLFGDFVTVQVLHKTENTLQSQKMCSNKKCNAQNLHILYITVAQQWRRIGLIPPILRIWPQIFIYIATYGFSCHTTWIKSFGMPYPGLDIFWGYVHTPSSHCL